MSDVIFGIHPVQEALRGGIQFDRVYVSQGRKGKGIREILTLAKAQNVDVRFEPPDRLNARIRGKTSHQGVVGMIAAFTYVSLEEILSALDRLNEPPFLLVLDQIQDPHNLGAILRSAECAGVHGVILPKRKSADITATVTKVSAGATAYIPICRVTNVASTIDILKEHGLWVIGSSDKARQAYTDADFTMPVALVIGNEEKGMRRLVTEKCDILVSIPLAGNISSLNASVASAVLAFEVRRQRQAAMK